MANHPYPKRRDSKHRVLRNGESVRADGKYQFKYYVGGKIKFVYSWRLEPTDTTPQGKKPGPSLRELEKQIGRDLDSLLDPTQKNMTVLELVERYLATKTGVRPNTLMNYNFVVNLLQKEEFALKKIGEVKTSDAKLFLIKLQQDGKGYSTVKTVRGVLRPAFKMAVDDDLLNKNPFGFELAGVVVNDSVTREAITRDQMKKFLKFVHDDNCYCKYYEVVYILFHTGMRISISEFCGLTISDIDFEHHLINIDHQLQRSADMTLVIQETKTHAGTRKLPMTADVEQCFRAIIEDRPTPRIERMVDGRSGFLFLDKDCLPEVAMHWEHRFNHESEDAAVLDGSQRYRRHAQHLHSPGAGRRCRGTSPHGGSRGRPQGAGKARGQGGGCSETVQSRLTSKTRKALCELQSAFFSREFSICSERFAVPRDHGFLWLADHRI